MKRSISGVRCAAACTALSLALACGCAALPPASGVPGSAGSSAASVPTDAEGKPLYDAARLEDSKLRALYGYDAPGTSTTILCGSKVLYQSASSESVGLVSDTITGGTDYWSRSWSDPTGRGGRRSALYDKDGREVMAFDGEQSISLQNGLLILQESRLVGNEYQDDSYGTCQVIDLATGENLPVPDGAYDCIVCGDQLVFNCYTLPEGLDGDAWDDDASLHSSVIIQTKDGTQTYGAASSTASRLSYEPDVLDGWVELDTYHADGSATDTMLYNPATGESLSGYRQTCGNGTAAFYTGSSYELRDLTTADRTVLGTFDALPTNYFPGYMVGWRTDGDYSYTLYDLATGERTALDSVSSTSSEMALYTKDGSLKVYDTTTGELLSETDAGALPDGQRLMMDSEEGGYTWMEFHDNDTYQTTSIRVYGPEGLVSDLTHLNDTYNYLGYLTTDTDGQPLYYGTRSAPGSSYGTVYDVLDKDGNVVLYSLAGCYGYYNDSLNALPDHVFEAKRGFYYGWMDADGSWLYCQSIFSTLNADDEMGY